MSFILLGILNSQIAGGNNFAYWLAASQSTGTQTALGVRSDSSENLYIAGQYYASAKYDIKGNFQFVNALSTTSFADNKIAVTASGNHYVIYRNYSLSKTHLIKYDADGILQWGRDISASAGYVSGMDVALDSSENIYVVGKGNNPSYRAMLFKYNSSGTLQWQRKLSGGVTVGNSITIDSSNNIYIAGAGAPNSSAWIAKYNSSGVIQWQKALGSSDHFNGMTTDSSGNIYCVGRTPQSGDVHTLLVKYNSSGVIQWQYRFGTVGASMQGRRITIDSSANLYITSIDAYSNLNIAKFNSSGTLQWQRTKSGSDESDIYITSSGKIALATYAGSEWLLGVLPVDGSFTGSYTIGIASATFSVSSHTRNTSSLTEYSGSLTEAAGSETDAATTVTQTTSTITSEEIEV